MEPAKSFAKIIISGGQHPLEKIIFRVKSNFRFWFYWLLDISLFSYSVSKIYYFCVKLIDLKARSLFLLFFILSQIFILECFSQNLRSNNLILNGVWSKTIYRH